MVDVASPRAARLATPRWLDARLVTGLLLVLLSVVAGARVFASAAHYSLVYVAKHDLVPGERLTGDDVTVARMRLPEHASRYVAAESRPVGYVVMRFVGARELLPVAALATSPAAGDSRLVTVPVAAGHLPPDLGHGSLVDVYLTARSTSGSPTPAPVRVLEAAAVQGRDGGSRLYGSGSALAVVLAVPAERVADLVHAVESGTIDLVAVPPAAAAALRSAS